MKTWLKMWFAMRNFPTPLQKLTHFLYSHTWLQFLRLQVLRAYFRRDFVSFEKLLTHIEPHDSEFVEFSHLFKRQLLEGSVSFDEWKALLDKVEVKKINPIINRKIYTELVTKALHLGNLHAAKDILIQKIQKFRFHLADIGLSNGILKLHLKLNDSQGAKKFRELIFQLILNENWKALVNFKLLEVSLELEEKLGKQFDMPLWKVALGRIEHADIPFRVKSEFKKLESLYLKIEAEHELLLDIRSSQIEKNRMFELIQTHLQNQTPYLMLRLGDGESYGMKMDTRAFKKDQHTRERKWWGTQISQELREQLMDRFQQTLQSSDVIGIPGVFRFIRDTWDSVHLIDLTSIKPKTTLRGIQAVMADVAGRIQNKKYAPNAIFVEHRCHQVLFSVDGIRSIGKHAKKIIIISHYDPAQIEHLFKDLNVLALQIPKERQGHQALPFVMDSYVAKLQSMVEPGTLVLVSAGFAGKYFLKIAKDQGGVALDVGAMADYWLGLKTRQVADII